MGGLFSHTEEPLSGSIAVEDEPAGRVLHLRGEVDAPVVRHAQEEGHLDGLGFVAVDVGALTYIDSTGLSLLVRWAQELARAGRPAVVRRTTARFQQVLRIAGLTSLFACEA
ncbi:MAG TPA: STAS domain-containing protein [Geodermatophilus sp.]|nr:STAS domain-containing protein [Geodermatophilus sp.]